MNYLSIKTHVLSQPELLKSAPNEVGTWFRTWILCGLQENGGRIKNGLHFSDIEWIAACGARKSDVAKVVAKGILISADGPDLLIWGYPLTIEREVQAKREGGRATVAKRWGKNDSSATSSAISSATSSPSSSATSSADSSPSSSAHSSADTYSNVRKGKVKKGKYTPLPPTTDVVEEIYSAYPKHVGKKSALKAIAKVLAEQSIDAETLLQKTKDYAAAVATWPSEKLEYRPDPASWFNGGRYDDDPAEWFRYTKKSREHPLGGEIDTSFDPNQPNAHTGGIPLAN